mgnify:CR=1 FL=1|jgi:hypothetical protein
MQLPSELLHPLAGLRLLARGDARGLSNFDISDDGMIRSFRAVLFCLPAFLVYAILRRIEFLQILPDLGRPHLVFIFQVLVIEASNWCFTVLFLMLAGFVLGLRPLIRPLIVMLNWAAVPVVYAVAIILTPVLMLLNHRSTLQWMAETLLLLAVLIGALVITWRILHTVIGGPKWRRTAFLLATVLPPLWMIRTLEHAMGLTVAHG